MNNKNAFTLIELLVVTITITLFMLVAIPSLKAAREPAFEAVCMNNQKQLCIAWNAYHNDNKGLLVGGSNYYSGTRATPYRWVEYPLRNDTDNIEVTGPVSSAEYSLATRKNGIRAGKLYPYTQNETLYHCPADINYTKPEPSAVYRSYSIAGLMNGEDFINRVSGIYSPIANYRSAVVTPGGAAKQLRVAIKFGEIVSPTQKYVFIEEDVVSKVPSQYLNAGSFVLCAGGAFNWWDRPAYFHDDNSVLGFADGHAEHHQWTDTDTINLIKTGMSDPNPSQNADLQWLVDGYTPIPVQ